jgi:hypothetical protein
MPVTVGSIVQRIAAALDDPNQRFWTEARIRPYLNTCWEDIYAKLAEFGITWPNKVVVLANLPALTGDLSAYQMAGQPLEKLVQPTYLHWKPGEQGAGGGGVA